MISRILEIYARCGKSLQSIGIYEAVIPISEVCNVLELFEKSNIIIAGGDIYKNKEETGFELTYDNWFYQGHSVNESIDKARLYLNKFENQEIYVSLVVKNS